MKNFKDWSILFSNKGNEMANKKQLPAKQYFNGIGSIKVLSEGIVIEGYANRKTVDRGNELIAADAWALDNYKKNPVILYNHGFDPNLGSTPIGKAVEITPSEDGLRIKAVLSKLNDPMLNRIRGLVEEKILRAFSVGFNPTDSTVDAKTGVKTITKAELFEVSIVGVPMNQDSLFELTSKMMKKSVEDIKGDVLNRKGAWVAAAIHNKIYELQKEGVDRDETLTAVAEKAAIEQDVLMDILAGNVTPVPENVLAAFSEALGLDLDALKKLDAGDVEVSGEKKEPIEDGSNEGDKEDGEVDGQAQGESETTKGDSAGEKGGGEGSKGTDKIDVKEQDFQQCVSDKIGKLIAEGKDQDQAVAAAISMCSDKGKKVSPTKADYAVWFKQADELVAAKVKTADQGVAVPPVTTEITIEKTEAAQNDFGSPYLEGQKQTNVLLGALINEIQKLNAAVAGSKIAAGSADESAKAEAPPPPKPDAAVTEPAPADVAPVDKPKEIVLIPDPKMSEDELKAAQKARAEKFGIGVLDGAALVFADSEPTKLEAYGDPVNLKYVIDSADSATKSRDEFKKAAEDYGDDNSKAAVHNRIVSAQLEYGAEPSFDEKDSLDALLSNELKDKLKQSNAKSLDSYRKRLENIKNRLVSLGA